MFLDVELNKGVQEVNRNKSNNKYRIVLTRALKWKLQGVTIIQFDSYFRAREYRANL